MKYVFLLSLLVLTSACIQLPNIFPSEPDEKTPLIDTVVISESKLLSGQTSTVNIILHNARPHPIDDLKLHALYTGPLLVDWIPCPNVLMGTNDIPSGERASWLEARLCYSNRQNVRHFSS